MKVTVFGLLIIVAMDILFSDRVMADQRSYVWTYEYLTVPKGEAELETYFTISAPEKDNLKGNTSTEHRFEFEVGMNERFDFAIYQIFLQEPAEESLRYKGFRLRARYRIGEKGRYFVDPLIYLEYKGLSDFSEHGVEAKLILAKDLGRFNIALNPIVDFEFGDKNEVEAEYTLGMSYKINDLLRLGIEAKGSKDGHYVGPVIAHGKGRFWVTLGLTFNVGSVEEGKPKFQTRMLLGIRF